MSDHEDNKLDQILSEIGKINRGLYGDPDNKVPGLMQSHYEVKEDVQSLKDSAKKKTWTIAGFSAAASLTLPVIWEWFKKHLGL